MSPKSYEKDVELELVEHDSPRVQTCTFQGPGASNTTKIRREDHQEREERMKNVAGKFKKREILGSHPSELHHSGFPPSGPPPLPLPQGRVKGEGRGSLRGRDFAIFAALTLA